MMQKSLPEDKMKVVEGNQQDQVLFLTINKPQSLNALSVEVMTQLDEQLIAAEKNKSVKVIVITGKGKAFVAGADINEFLMINNEKEGREYSRLGQNVFSKIASHPKPVICAINGYALGGGLELALACDIRFASEHALLGLPEVKLGLFPGYGGSQRLPRLIGKGRAYYLMMSGETITAHEAERIGLVERVVPAAALLEEVRIFASKISEFPQEALAALKESVSTGVELPIDEALKLDAKEIGRLMVADETRARAAAFINRK